MSEAQRIADGLSEAQRELVLELSGAWKICTVEEARFLDMLGLTGGRKTAFGYAVRLRKLGLAVRSLLTAKDGDES